LDKNIALANILIIALTIQFKIESLISYGRCKAHAEILCFWMG